MPLLPVSRTILYICDVQLRLLPSIANNEAIVRAMRMASKGAAELGVPVVISEQYPKGVRTAGRP
jgi:hypothetical protein